MTNPKCLSCFRLSVCMICSSFLMSFECLGPFLSESDRLEKFKAWFKLTHSKRTSSKVLIMPNRGFKRFRIRRYDR